MNELFPEWEKIVNGVFMMASIHGDNITGKDAEILKEFGQLMKEIGISTKNKKGD